MGSRNLSLYNFPTINSLSLSHLDFEIDGSFAIERRGEVDFEEPRLEVGTDEDVEPVELEAVPLVWHKHLAGAVHGEFHRYYTLKGRD